MSADAASTFAGMVIVPVTVIALSIPLILRIIPRNSWYGFRTAKTLSSDVIWYQTNYIGGLYMLIASSVQLAGLITILLIATDESVDFLATNATAVLLAPLIIAIVAWFLRTHGLRS